MKKVSKNKTPLALALTDTHLHKNNYKLVKDIFQQAIDICEKRAIRYMFHVGDFFTSREAQPLLVLKEAREILRLIQVNGLDFFIIGGNHDKTHLDSEDSYLLPLEKFEHTFIHKEAYFDIAGIRTIWLPYFKENSSYCQRLNNASKMIKSGATNVLFTHIGVSGVTNNDKSAVDNNVKAKLFKKFDKVFVGHYHDQQDYDNIYYIGGAFQQNYGEDNIKGFTILNTDGSHEFIKSKFPEYIKEKVNVEDSEAIKKLKKQYANSEDHVRIILTGNKEKLQSFNKADLQNAGIDVKFESDSVKHVDISKQEIQMFDRSNLKAAFDKFCKLNQIKDKEFGFKYLEQIL